VYCVEAKDITTTRYFWKRLDLRRGDSGKSQGQQQRTRDQERSVANGVYQITSYAKAILGRWLGRPLDRLRWQRLAIVEYGDHGPLTVATAVIGIPEVGLLHRKSLVWSGAFEHSKPVLARDEVSYRDSLRGCRRNYEYAELLSLVSAVEATIVNSSPGNNHHLATA
jgi:hypothetical protein